MPRMEANWHKDADGQTHPDEFVGKQFFHPKTGHLYEVTGYGIDSQREVWLLFYKDTSSRGSDFTFCHTITDFKREGRFMQVKG